jgi:protein involved in polysaccharide export with SLBB domain
MKYTMIINSRLFLLTAIGIVLISNLLYSQLDRHIDNSYLTGAKEKELDTLHLKTAKEIADETIGLLEREINPDEYIMGPGDVLNISIISTKVNEYKVTVSPDGNILIPGIGIVDVKGRTLSDTKGLIQECVDRVYKSHEVFIAMEQLREFKVIVSGSVRKPAIVPATAVDRVSEVIERAGGLKFDASTRNILLVRNQGKEISNVDLLKFNVGYKESNPTVLGGDQVIVPPSNKEHTIQIWGEVPLEGIFEYVEGDSLSTLFKFAHGFLKSANLDSVEIARFDEHNASSRRFFLDLSSWKEKFHVSNELENDIALKIGDRVFVRPVKNWQDKKMVVVEGEVNYRGKYAIDKKDTRVYDILMRAGGPTNEASLDGAVLTRQKEIEKVDREMRRLESIPSSEMSENERRYFQARRNEQKGVMAIDFRNIMTDPNSEDNIVVIDEDSIFVPSKQNFINVQGRVNNPGLVIYKEGYTYMDYIALAGGFGFRAEEDETLIVKKKGEQFLAEDMNYILEPGDNILVPPIEAMSAWQFWSTFITVATQIISIAATVLAIWSLTSSSKN